MEGGIQRILGVLSVRRLLRRRSSLRCGPFRAATIPIWFNTHNSPTPTESQRMRIRKKRYFPKHHQEFQKILLNREKSAVPRVSEGTERNKNLHER